MTPFAKIELRTALPSDEPSLRRIWRESFGDDDEYIDFFLTRRFVPDNTPVLAADGTVVSQLFLLPALLRTGEQLHAIDYLFAAATDPAYRKAGCMARLLDYAAELSARRGREAIVLLPGTQALYRYYAKHGYQTAFQRRILQCRREELPAAVPPEDDAVSTLNAYYQHADGIVWDTPAIRYALAEHNAFRGRYAASGRAFAAVSGEEAAVIAPPDDVEQGLSLLPLLSDAPCFTVTLPPDAPFGKLQDGGMVRFLKDAFPIQNAFVSFAME